MLALVEGVQIFLKTLLRKYPLYSGAGRIANSGFFRTLTKDKTTMPAKLLNGATIYVDPSNLAGRVIYFFGDFDKKITWVCRRVLRPGDLVLDIGANVGLVSLIAADLVGLSGQVHAFEPQPGLVDLIQKSLAANALHSVTVHPFALSDSDRQATLYVPGSNSCYASLLDYNRPDDRAMKVEVKHAGAYLASVVGLRKARLLKIDVEGHEAAVLRGARDYLEASPPDCILFEIHTSDLFWGCEMVQIMDELGYDFLGVPHVLWPMRLQRLERGQEPHPDTRDGLAVLHSKRSELLPLLI